MEDMPELLELFGVPDTFASGLGSVEDIGGGCFRFTFFAKQEAHGRTEHMVVAKIIMTLGSLPAAMHLTAMTTNTCACEGVRRMARN